MSGPRQVFFITFTAVLKLLLGIVETVGQAYVHVRRDIARVLERS